MRRKENCVASIRYDLYAAEVTGMPDIKCDKAPLWDL